MKNLIAERANYYKGLAEEAAPTPIEMAPTSGAIPMRLMKDRLLPAVLVVHVALLLSGWGVKFARDNRSSIQRQHTLDTACRAPVPRGIFLEFIFTPTSLCPGSGNPFQLHVSSEVLRLGSRA